MDGFCGGGMLFGGAVFCGDVGVELGAVGAMGGVIGGLLLAEQWRY